MKIAIIGAGNIGGTLGRKWGRAGHAVMFGVRDAADADVRKLLQESGGRAGTAGEAIAFGEVVLFAIPGKAMEEMLRAHGASLAGKTAIDAANNVEGGVMNSAAAFAQHAPEAKVYRAFNSLGWENFEDPRFGDTIADLFYCGPAGGPQSTVERLISEAGLRPVYLGGPEKTPLVDAVTGIWFALVFGQKKGRHLAFKVLTRNA